MAKAQAALLESDEVKELINEFLTDMLTRVLHAKGIPVPRPVVQAAVARAVEHVANLDSDDIVWDAINTLRENPLVKVAAYVLDTDFAATASRVLKRKVREFRDDAPSDEDACEVECPVSGDTIALEEGDGTYECPDCGLGIAVEDGEAEHEVSHEVTCPESGDTITLGDDGTYECPDCEHEILVDDGIATHAIEVECPVERTTVWAGPEEATWECPECGKEIVVEDGEAEHEDASPRIARRPQSARRRRASK